MPSFSEKIRKLTTVLLAVFLWLHGIFLLNVQSPFLLKGQRLLHLSSSEITLLAMLLIFSFASGSGFWKPLRSLIYVYFFPFVLIGYGFYWAFIILRGLNRWFVKESSPQLGSPVVANQQALTVLS